MTEFVWDLQDAGDFYQAIKRVRELHKPVENEIGTYCYECIDNPDSWRYPCPTIKALDGEQ